MEDNKLLSSIGNLVVIIGSMIIEVMFVGLALSILWNWFVVPVFELPSITNMQAYSLMLVAAAIQGFSSTSQTTTDELTMNQRFFKALTRSIARSATLLFVGWIIHLTI